MISHKDLLICIFNGTIKIAFYVKQNRRDFHKQIKSFSKTRVKLHMGWIFFGCRTDGKVSMTDIIIAIRVLEAKLKAKNLENSSSHHQSNLKGPKFLLVHLFLHYNLVFTTLLLAKLFSF